MESWKEELYHSQGPWKKHDYIRKYKDAAGKWVYEYKQKSGVNVESGGWDNGDRDKQSWTYAETKNGSTVGVVKGSNRADKYVGVTVGKTKDDYNYKEKEAKIGRVSVNYDNENGTHNVTVHVAHKTTNSLSKDTVNKGASTVKKLLGIN